MKLFEEVAEAPVSELNTLGTVSSQIGAKGTIGFNPANLLRTDKLIVVELTNGAGKVQKVYCSAPLSAEIRKSKPSAQDLRNLLGSLQIAITTNGEGEERFKIVRHQGVMVTGKVTAAAPVALTNPEEIAW